MSSKTLSRNEPTGLTLKSRDRDISWCLHSNVFAILFGQLREHKVGSKGANLAAVQNGEVSEIAALPSSPGAVFVLSSDDPKLITVGSNGDVLGTDAANTSFTASHTSRSGSCSPNKPNMKY